MNPSLEQDFLARLLHQGFSHHAKARDSVLAEAGRREFPLHVINLSNITGPRDLATPEAELRKHSTSGR